jgi:hypothetical protein
MCWHVWNGHDRTRPHGFVPRLPFGWSVSSRAGFRGRQSIANHNINNDSGDWQSCEQGKDDARPTFVLYLLLWSKTRRRRKESPQSLWLPRLDADKRRRRRRRRRSAPMPRITFLSSQHMYMQVEVLHAPNIWYTTVPRQTLRT